MRGQSCAMPVCHAIKAVFPHKSPLFFDYDALGVSFFVMRFMQFALKETS